MPATERVHVLPLLQKRELILSPLAICSSAPNFMLSLSDIRTPAS
ncbi:hypothetical protein yfred0001_44080 [Yersinia frederiksenii ATCC 33641]|nr:hypothetical protein yfred0001_44080 [Yersinia frederiksenii ATCC 33641]